MDRPTLTRRTALRSIAVLATGSLAAAGVVSRGTGPAAAATVDDTVLAEDVRVERNDGRIEAVTVAPDLTVSWRDYGDGVEEVAVTVSAAIEDEPGFDVLYELRVDDDGTIVDERADRIGTSGNATVEGDDFDAVDGTVEIDLGRRNLAAVGDHVTAEDFGGDLGPGESTTTTVELTVRVDVDGRQGASETVLETVSFDVTVHNPEGEATATGRMNTGVE